MEDAADWAERKGCPDCRGVANNWHRALEASGTGGTGGLRQPPSHPFPECISPGDSCLPLSPPRWLNFSIVLSVEVEEIYAQEHQVQGEVLNWKHWN